MTEINGTKWLSDWYSNNCNEDWEHKYGVKIDTIDNPGWTIEIDFEDTGVTIENRAWEIFGNSPTDWYGYKVEDGKYEASGDPSKLERLILIFKNLVENPTFTRGATVFGRN